ncbi:MAG: hypothetical protein AABY05_02595 [Nanoarchaeota archaeon]
MGLIELDSLTGIVEDGIVSQDRTTTIGLKSKEVPDKNIVFSLPVKYEFRAGDEIYLRQVTLEEKGEVSMKVIRYKWMNISVKDSNEKGEFRRVLTLEGRDMNLINYARDNY